MTTVHEGQCGLCTHFGEHSGASSKSLQLVEILSTRQASEELISDCGHPKLANLHLRVTPVSGCDGFQAAA